MNLWKQETWWMMTPHDTSQKSQEGYRSRGQFLHSDDARCAYSSRDNGPRQREVSQIWQYSFQGNWPWKRSLQSRDSVIWKDPPNNVGATSTYFELSWGGGLVPRYQPTRTSLQAIPTTWYLAPQLTTFVTCFIFRVQLVGKLRNENCLPTCVGWQWIQGGYSSKCYAVYDGWTVAMSPV